MGANNDETRREDDTATIRVELSLIKSALGFYYNEEIVINNRVESVRRFEKQSKEAKRYLGAIYGISLTKVTDKILIERTRELKRMLKGER